jgi:hypothetical protein
MRPRELWCVCDPRRDSRFATCLQPDGVTVAFVLEVAGAERMSCHRLPHSECLRSCDVTLRAPMQLHMFPSHIDCHRTTFQLMAARPCLSYYIEKQRPVSVRFQLPSQFSLVKVLRGGACVSCSRHHQRVYANVYTLLRAACRQLHAHLRTCLLCAACWRADAR